MTFSTKVKYEIIDFIPERSCCAKATIYGMLECGSSFDINEISLKTQNEKVAQTYCSAVSKWCNLDESQCLNEKHTGGIHRLSIPNVNDRKKILGCFGHSQKDTFLRINRANFECDDCAGAYISGAFLSCGAMSNPQSSYHMEFSIDSLYLFRDFATLFREVGIDIRDTRRKGNYILYLKESEQIEDCLTLMRATNASMEIMNIKIIKDIRNTANRVTNCESANISKTVKASVEQSFAIRKLIDNDLFETLPDELKPLSLLRLENPEMSLRELGESLDPPLSRSGVNHRLKRIIQIADKI